MPAATEKWRRRPGALGILFKCAEDLAAWLLPFMIVDAIAQFTWAQITKPSDFGDGPWQTLWLKVGNLHIAYVLLISNDYLVFRSDWEPRQGLPLHLSALFHCPHDLLGDYSAFHAP